MLEDLQITSAPDDATQPAAVTSAPRRGGTQRTHAEPHLLDYARVVVKRRHVALVAFSVVALAAIVYSFTATPVYEGRVQLLIESSDPNVIDFKQVTGDGMNANTLARQDYYQTQYRLLQSRSVAHKTIETLKLWENPELRPGLRDQGFSVSGAARAATGWVGGLFGGGAHGEERGGDETAAQAEAIDAFLDRLTVSPVRNSRLVEIAFRSEHPKMAASVANTVAKSYIDMNLDFRFRSTREASEWLEQQLADQRKDVESAEARLQWDPLESTCRHASLSIL